MRASPFEPTFGANPPLLVGRDDQLDDFVSCLEDGARGPARATLYVGLRGVGKTVMLNAVEDEARSHGWLVVSEFTGPNMLTRLAEERLPKAAQLLQNLDQYRSRITGAGIAGLGSLTRQVTELHQPAPGLATQLDIITEALTQTSVGLLITVDEIHKAHTDKLAELTGHVQMLFREGRPVMFAAAGLPTAVSQLLKEESSTFLRRADRHELSTVDPAEVAQAIRQPVIDAGKTIEDAALAVATEATGGYPFMIQLVGHHTWRAAPEGTEILTVAHVEQGAAMAVRKVGSLVLETSLGDLSATDRSFLAAMSVDAGPSKMADIQERLQVDANFASQYRLRLLNADMITAVGHGYVDFTVPHLREYLREHAASLGVSLGGAARVSAPPMEPRPQSLRQRPSEDLPPPPDAPVP